MKTDHVPQDIPEETIEEFIARIGGDWKTLLLTEDDIQLVEDEEAEVVQS